MAAKTGQLNVFAAWADKIDAKRRVNAVCKPCWEVKYCPYGPLVEEFPFADDDDDRRCRIFGHQCPVFHVAEPFTETKELRNVSRTISRPTQFRVLKRENQACRACNQHVADEDVHFDHIIPWSKGGSSDEHNVQLLCSRCNRKKSNKYEEEHLISSFRDHVVDPVGAEILDYLWYVLEFAHTFRAAEGVFPNADDIANRLNNGEKGRPEEQAASIIATLDEFFRSERPREVSQRAFRALRDRWGFAEGTIYTLRSVAHYYDIPLEGLLDADLSLVRRLGWSVSLNATARRTWLRS